MKDYGILPISGVGGLGWEYRKSLCGDGVRTSRLHNGLEQFKGWEEGMSTGDPDVRGG